MLYRKLHHESLLIYIERQWPRLLLCQSEKNGWGMCRMFFSHSCGFMEEMLHVSASSQRCSLYINATLKGTNDCCIDSLFCKKEKKMLRCNLYTSSGCSCNNCVTIKSTPQWNVINTLSHISGLSFTLTAPCVWLNLPVSEFTWCRLSPGFIYTQWPGSSISQCSHLLLQIATLQSCSEGMSLRK